jgi:hydroxyacylglutathione hydrolase
MSHLEMHVFLCLSDNIGCLVHDHKTGATAAIDAPDGEAVERELRKRGLQLTHILVTHHHADHTDGIPFLKDRYGCRVTGPKAEAEKIKGLDTLVAGGDSFAFAGRDVHVIDTPGHTAGHIAYHIPAEYSLFAGDTLFALGCGRVIEGTMDQMHESLGKLKRLQPHTHLYCGHEYTEANARFALSVEPGNRDLQQRAAAVAETRAQGRLTVPSTMGEEVKTNPFLRDDSAEIRQVLNMGEATDAEVFAEVRRRKNSF